MQIERFPALNKPPIVEVVCGIHFEPLELDGLVLGVYWDRRSADFPTGSLQPALSEAAGFILGQPPLRAVLVGGDSVHVLQIQHDRFFLNWRAMGTEYPRFSSREGRPGLMAEALAEFERLCSFCDERFGRRPSVTQVELAKIDVLKRGQYWEDPQDLAGVIHLTGSVSELGPTGSREFALRFGEHEGDEKLFVSMTSVLDKPGGTVDAVRLETRAVSPCSSEQAIEAAFSCLNSKVNKTFFRIISPEGLQRFEPEGEVR